jgi:hypothetical protein
MSNEPHSSIAMTKNFLYTIGVILLLIGVWGFFQNPILGLFAVDTMHNLVHVITGILALVFAAMGENAARSYSKTLGVIYGIVLILGLISPDNTVLGLMTVNAADNFLHLILSALFLYFGFANVPVLRRAYASRDLDDDYRDRDWRNP